MAKIHYTEAKELLSKHSYNRFDTDAWQEFKDSFRPAPPLKFVDVEGNRGTWVNDEETAVFLLELNTPAGRFEPLCFASFLLKLRPDEYDFIPVSPDVYIIRLWWD
jgi:hypothetical protein